MRADENLDQQQVRATGTVGQLEQIQILETRTQATKLKLLQNPLKRLDGKIWAFRHKWFEIFDLTLTTPDSRLPTPAQLESPAGLDSPATLKHCTDQLSPVHLPGYVPRANLSQVLHHHACAQKATANRT